MPATASRPATPAERAGVVAGVKATGYYRRLKPRIGPVIVSTVDRRFALADLTFRLTGGAGAILRRGTDARWRSVYLGTDFIDVPGVPRRVVRDLVGF